jgi:AGCS family alanine or glycine:cation symporter
MEVLSRLGGAIADYFEPIRVAAGEGFGPLLGALSGLVWGPWMLVLLFGTHIFLTIRLRFIQRYIGRGIRLSLQRTAEGEGDVSHFGALTTALAATIGTGNIVGVATAVVAGGPGAVLWMWLTGVFGISTKYAEALLSVKYRVATDAGHFAGGPMYVLDRGLHCKWLGVLFAAFTAVAAFGIGNMCQANAISRLLAESRWNVNPWISGTIMMLLTGMVILGGIKSIARVCEILVPFMAIAYVIGCVTLLIIGLPTIPATVALIFKSAFTAHAAVGGFLGAGVRQAMRYGIARGLFSNESGLGSAPIVAAAAKTKDPVRQALVSSTGTFWDTVVICALTGLVLVNSGHWTDGTLNGASLTAAAFNDVPVFGTGLLTLGLLTFVFSTILGWSYYGERAAEYLFGKRSILPYRLLWVAFVLVGSVSRLQAVWDFADIANALMAIPNLIALILLSGVVVAETRKHLWEAPAPNPASPKIP